MESPLGNVPPVNTLHRDRHLLLSHHSMDGGNRYVHKGVGVNEGVGRQLDRIQEVMQSLKLHVLWRTQFKSQHYQR